MAHGRSRTGRGQTRSSRSGRGKAPPVCGRHGDGLRAGGGRRGTLRRGHARPKGDLAERQAQPDTGAGLQHQEGQGGDAREDDHGDLRRHEEEEEESTGGRFI
eukprot:7990826-Heterocapsa_arctica.AAC.1